VIGFLQEKGKGATWMFEDAFGRNQHWRKFLYTRRTIEQSVQDAAAWAEEFITHFGAFQQKVLPWMKSGKTP
jgi:heme oxygenase